MEIQLEDLKAIFDKARVNCELDAFRGHEMRCWIHVAGDDLYINVQDTEDYTMVVEIVIPVQGRTTLHF